MLNLKKKNTDPKNIMNALNSSSFANNSYSNSQDKKLIYEENKYENHNAYGDQRPPIVQ